MQEILFFFIQKHIINIPTLDLSIANHSLEL